MKYDVCCFQSSWSVLILRLRVVDKVSMVIQCLRNLLTKIYIYNFNFKIVCRKGCFHICYLLFHHILQTQNPCKILSKSWIYQTFITTSIKVVESVRWKVLHVLCQSLVYTLFWICNKWKRQFWIFIYSFRFFHKCAV